MGLTGAKAEITLARPYRQVMAQIVIGKRENNVTVEQQLHGSISVPIMPASSKVTAGFVVLPEKQEFVLFIQGATMEVDMPPGYTYDFQTMNPAGIYEDGVLVFAFETIDPNIGVTRIAEMKRYVGVRIHLYD